MKGIAAPLTLAEADTRYSSLREKIVEHLFLGEILRGLWAAGKYGAEVSRSESDSFGYDVVIECGPVIRHIQLKSKRGRPPRKVSIARSLGKKPGGCVVCMILENDLRIRDYRWFGGSPGNTLPSMSGLSPSKRLRRDKAGERPPRSNHIDVPISKFEMVSTIADLTSKLFGP